ncbi:hypothetical protein BH10CYA1_BH10CYA1_20450 [soil metagenome]
MKNWFSSCLALSLAIVCQAMAVAHPAMFSEMTLAEAKAQAKKEGKLLLVDFTAAWCPPCGEMDKTTWEDPRVVKWIKANAIAIQIDVDKEKSIASDLKVVAMPSLVVFKDKADEVDRTLGFQDGEELISWLTAINSGVTSMDKMQQQLETARGKGGEKELDARYDLARAQFQAGRYADSQENFLWLWQNMAKINPALRLVRLTMLSQEISDLIAKYPAAKVRFGKLRDEVELTNLDDWITLNHGLGDDNLSFIWFEKAKGDPAQSSKLREVAFKLEPIFIKAGRWSDAAVFLKEPITQLRSRYEMSQDVLKHTEGVNPFPRVAGTMYACLLAAGRNEEAERVAEESLKLENTPEVIESLVFSAFDAGQLQPSLQARLDDVDSTPSDGAGYYKRGAIYLKLKVLDKALANFSKAIELLPTEPTYYDAREAVLCDLKHFDKALADADHVIQIYPKSDRAYISRGFIHLKQKNDALALKDFEEAIKLNPNDPLSLINESAVYERQGKYQLAFEAADKAVKLDANNAGGFCNRGEAAFKLRKFEVALADLSKSIDIGKTLCGGENFYYRAKVYEALGKTELANLDKQSAKEMGYLPEASEL